MRCYRRVLIIPWTDHRTNEWILTRLEGEKTLLAQIRKLNSGYHGHVMRKTHCLEKT